MKAISGLRLSEDKKLVVRAAALALMCNKFKINRNYLRI